MYLLEEIIVEKKDGTKHSWSEEKLFEAVNKSATRCRGFNPVTGENAKLTTEESVKLLALVQDEILKLSTNLVTTKMLHTIVENSLMIVAPDVGAAYMNYHNFRLAQARQWEEVQEQCNSAVNNGDTQNANADSSLASTLKCFTADYAETKMYEETMLTAEEKLATKDGYIYIHDKNGLRLYPYNCCLARVGDILKNGFTINNVTYTEPKNLDVAFDVTSDIILSGASQQYGGFTVPRIDSILAPYAEKSFNELYEKYIRLGLSEEKAKEIAYKEIEDIAKQGFQGFEMKFNTVASSRGDYPFITLTGGLENEVYPSGNKWGPLLWKAALNVRRIGQGPVGKKKPVLVPKLVFLFDENLHTEGKELYDVYLAGLECSAKTMYPDWLSLTGKGYISNMYKKYGIDGVISPMGCVDGKEIVTYKFNSRLYVESFERFWKRMSDHFEVKTQPAGKVHLYMDLENVLIYDTEKGFVKTSRIIRNLSDKWVDVHFSNGRRLLCTQDHPITTSSGKTKQAKDLTTMDEVLINSSNYSEETIMFHPDKAWLLGFMLCDGCYQNHSLFASIALNGEDEIEEKFKQTINKYFELEGKTVLQERGKKGSYKDLVVVSNGDNAHKQAIQYFTEKFGGINKMDRHIPNEVFEWNYEAKLAFLAGMIDADGSLNNTKNKSSIIQIGSTNKELALQQMALAQTLGMPAKMYHNHYDKKHPGKIRYRVEFYPIEELIPYIVCDKKTDIYDFPKTQIYNTKASVLEVNTVSKCDYSYDVTTESEHFEVSGIYSHNCRAFLSPWYERGGMEPADENDKPIYEGRFNLGVVSLHLSMIYQKSVMENKDFYEVLDYYLNMIHNILRRHYRRLATVPASRNPLMFCEGGAYMGHLKPSDKIEPLLKYATASFGITALNELQQLHNGKSLVEDGEFALEVMRYINDYVARIKKEDGHLYAIYGTPAEKLCNTQVRQFRTKYGIIKNVSDREYVSNSFHCHVTEDITPIQKQDLEYRFWELFNGGKIQYCRYNLDYNMEAMNTLILRAMEMGMYEGVNLSLNYCNDCGHEELEMGESCPKCGSKNITQIDRMNGYLGYTRQGSVEKNYDSTNHNRFAKHKVIEIAERKSM